MTNLILEQKYLLFAQKTGYNNSPDLSFLMPFGPNKSGDILETVSRRISIYISSLWRIPLTFSEITYLILIERAGHR